MKFPILADIIFYSAVTWLVTFTIMRYYALPLWLCIVVAFLFMFAIGMTTFLLSSRKHNQKKLNQREREAKEALMLHLTLATDEQVRKSLFQALTARNEAVSYSDNDLILDEKCAVPLFTMEAVTADDVALLIRRHRTSFILLCNELSPSAEKLLRSFQIKVMRGDEIYQLFSSTNTTPNPLICGELPRYNLKAKVHLAFSKRNARPYFVSGSLLLIMSLFAIFPVYYLVTGIVLLFCSVVVRFFGYANA